MKKLLTAMLSTILCISNIHAQTIPNDFTLEDLSKYVNEPTNCNTLACSSISQMSVEEINWNKKEIKLSFAINSRILSAALLPININSSNIKAILLDGKQWLSASKAGNQLSVVVPEGIHKVDVIMGMNSSLFSIELFEKPKNFTNNTTNANVQLTTRGSGNFLTISNSSQEKIVKEDTTVEKNISMTLPTKPFFIVTHNLFLKRTWKVQTVITPMPGSVIIQPIELEVPLLPSEKILDENIKIENGKVKVLMSNNVITWDSVIDKQKQLVIKAQSDNYFEQFNVYAAKEWLYDFSGLNPSGNINTGEYKSANQWQMWKGEELKLNFTRPAALEGSTSSVENYSMNVDSSSSKPTYNISFNYVSSLGGRTYVEIPKGFTIETLIVNGNKIERSLEQNKLALDLLGTTNAVNLVLKNPEDLTGFVQLPELKFDTHVRNKEYTMNNMKKWILFAGGGNIHPAILIWGILCSLIIFSFILSKTHITPYKTLSWTLLLFGLSQSGIISCLILVSAILLFGFKKIALDKKYFQQTIFYNTYQLVLIILTALSVLVVLWTLNQGLLNDPTVFISGINSNASTLYWYAENNNSTQPWVLLAPVWVYRILMFIWAIWFANQSIKLIKWIWEILSSSGLWKKDIKEIEVVNQLDNVLIPEETIKNNE